MHENTSSHKACLLIHPAAFFIITPHWKQLTCLSSHIWFTSGTAMQWTTTRPQKWTDNWYCQIIAIQRMQMTLESSDVKESGPKWLHIIWLYYLYNLLEKAYLGGQKSDQRVLEARCSAGCLMQKELGLMKLFLLLILVIII